MEDKIPVFRDEILKIKKAWNQSDITKSNEIIATHLLEKYKNNETIPKISVFARNINLSVATISKFIKTYNLENFSVIRFIFKCNSVKNNEEAKKDENQITVSSNMIKKANRIILFGSGNSGLVMKIFHTKLLKGKMNSSFIDYPKDQRTTANVLSKDDLIIWFSLSLSNKEILNTIIKNEIPAIIFTNQEIPSYKNIVTFVIENKDKKFNKEGFQEYRSTINIMGKIYETVFVENN